MTPLANPSLACGVHAIRRSTLLEGRSVLRFVVLGNGAGRGSDADLRRDQGLDVLGMGMMD